MLRYAPGIAANVETKRGGKVRLLVAYAGNIINKHFTKTSLKKQ
jgi:hypothetical protein